PPGCLGPDPAPARRPMTDPAALAARLAQEHLGGAAASVERLTGGQVGATFRVDLEGARERRCVVKLGRAQPLVSFEDEPAETRVYGGRWDNFDAAYSLLARHDLTLPAHFGGGAQEG